ncbi:MAG: ATP-dependent metallopeptidase FtsH/Yme1/Tma family protein [Bryobacteraceae bacterium]
MTTRRLLLIVLFVAFNFLALLAWRRHTETETPSISYSRFLNEVEAGQVGRIVIRRQTHVEGEYLDNRGRFRARVPSNDPDLYWTLRENGVDMEIDESVSNVALLAALAPAALFVGLLLRRRRRWIRAGNPIAPAPERRETVGSL